jgi:hypothetical protein
VLLDESQHIWVEQAGGRSIEETVDHIAEQGRFQLGLADEAWELLGSLG